MKSPKKDFTYCARMPSALHAATKARAESKGISTSEHIRNLLEADLKPVDDDWRSLTDADRDLFMGWFTADAALRMERGKTKYNSDNTEFQGDPLEHLSEELQDALFYCWFAMRKSAWERRNPERGE